MAGVLFGVAGALTATPIFLGAVGSGWRWMIATSAIAALLVGALAWRLLADRIRGWIVGAIVGVTAHPVAWWLLIVGQWLGGARSSLGERTLGPLEGVVGALVMSLWSLLLAGWLTVPVGAAIGVALGRRRA